jgi:hypothetical protein
MAAISTVLAATALTGSAVSGYGQYQSGKAQQAQAKYNAAVAQNNASAKAASVGARADQLARQQRELRGKQSMAVAATGGMAAGTDLLALADQASQMSLDQLELRRQKDIALQGGDIAAAQQQYAGKVARYTSKLSSAGSLISGVSSAAQLGATFTPEGSKFLGMEM